MHPLVDRDGFKIGVFSANADGGLAITTVPERWGASWDDNARVATVADDAGLDFLLPIARWKGFGGRTKAREHSFETFTWAAALAAITKRIALFATVHVPLLHPLYAAKALATLDHVSGGRAGLNIVCGWNPAEFAMFGVERDEHPYARAHEWLDVIERAYASEAPFDHHGADYRLDGVVSRPRSVQSPRPLIMNAAFGDAGRDFAAKRCDVLFSTFTDLADGARHVADLRSRSEGVGRNVGVFTVCHVVCRQDQAEAETYYRHYARDRADHEAVQAHLEGKRRHSGSHDAAAYERHAMRFAGGAGTYPLVGTPDHVADELERIAGKGYLGAGLSFVNYAEELPTFCAEVLPRLAERGLRPG